MPTDQNTQETAPLQVTQVGDWKTGREAVTSDGEEQGFITELPSGNVVRVMRTLDMPVLLKTGQIPNPLAGIVQGMIDTRSTTFPAAATDTQVLMQLLDLLNETAYRAILEPPFDMPEKRKKSETAEQYQERLEEWQPAKGKISVWDLTQEDRFYIFALAQGAAADLASFRAEQASALADVQAGAGVRKPTKRTGGSGSKKAKR